MPEKLAEYLKTMQYIPTFSKQIQEVYYINNCPYCKSIQGDQFLHEIPEQSFYRKLCYSSAEPISYAKVNNKLGVCLQAEPPYYDELSSSLDLTFAHMENGIENRASLNVNQKLINQLFACSIKELDIEINEL